MTEYWKSFATDVLWKTMKKAVLYSVLGGIICVVPSFVVLATTIPAGHSVTRKAVESVLLLSAFVAAGFGCGFVFGICTLQQHMERIVDAVYQTVRTMVGHSVSRMGIDPAQSIPTDRLRKILDSDAGVWLSETAKGFGSAKLIYGWIMPAPVRWLQQRIGSEFIPLTKELSVSVEALDEFTKKNLVRAVRLPLEAKLRHVRYAAIVIGCLVLALPVVLIQYM